MNSEKLQPSELSPLESKLTLGEALVNIWINVIYEDGIGITLIREFLKYVSNTDQVDTVFWLSKEQDPFPNNLREILL